MPLGSCLLIDFQDGWTVVLQATRFVMQCLHLHLPCNKLVQSVHAGHQELCVHDCVQMIVPRKSVLLGTTESDVQPNDEQSL